MKIMVISDTHGDTYYLQKVLDIFYERDYDKLYHLGDFGSASIKLLNPLKNKIKAVKGNNDYFIDKETRFKCDQLVEYDYVFNKFVMLTHGHYTLDIKDNIDILFHGHTHKSRISKVGSTIYACPGSISCPRDDIFSFIEFNEKEIKIYDLLHLNVINKIEL